MNLTFKAYVDELHPSFERLTAMVPLDPSILPIDMPERGVYLFTEAGAHLYVGRSNRLRARIQQHCRASSGHQSAAFAFLLARAACCKVATYKKTGGRVALCLEPAFALAFKEGRARVRKMQVRYVEECEPTRQSLLEMYVAISLRTTHNSFDNH